jgi:hypothetical protein
MKQLFKKGWFQIVLFGAVIGVVLIMLDNKYDLLGKKKDERTKYYGPVDADKDNVFVTRVDFTETSHDFKTVKEGDTVTHVFKIKNTGNEPLLIYKVVGSCDCTGAAYIAEPISPGTESKITAYFKTLGKKGAQVRTLRVTTNTDPPENVLTLTGTVE